MYAPSSLVIAFAMAALNPSASASNPPASSMQAIEAATAAYQKQQYATALKLFEAAAQKGDREAQHTLAFMYRDGKGTRRNDAKAMAWYRKSAEQGYAPAAYNLGLMYAQSEGVKPTPAAAQRWFRRAAGHGSGEEQVKLAEIGGHEDKIEEAVPWVRHAAQPGGA